MTLLVKDANTSVQSLSTVIDGNGALVPVHAPAASNAQGVASPVGPQNPLPVVNTAALAALEEAFKYAPAGSETVVANVRSAIAAAQSAYDNLAAINKQIYATVERTVEQSVATAQAAGKKAAKRK